jgi:hypothetical protein
MTLALMAQLDPTAGPRRRRAASLGMPQVASRFVPFELAHAPLSGRFTPAAAEQGTTVTVACILETTSLVPGVMLATLEGLPPRAVAEPVQFAPGAQRIAFRVGIAPDSPVGEHDTLICRLTGKVQGQTFVYRVGRGGLLRINPPGALSIDADGKPLSLLDALRRKERPSATKPTAREDRR